MKFILIRSFAALDHIAPYVDEISKTNNHEIVVVLSNLNKNFENEKILKYLKAL